MLSTSFGGRGRVRRRRLQRGGQLSVRGGRRAAGGEGGRARPAQGRAGQDRAAGGAGGWAWSCACVRVRGVVCGGILELSVEDARTCASPQLAGELCWKARPTHTLAPTRTCLGPCRPVDGVLGATAQSTRASAITQATRTRLTSHASPRLALPLPSPSHCHHHPTAIPPRPMPVCDRHRHSLTLHTHAHARTDGHCPPAPTRQSCPLCARSPPLVILTATSQATRRNAQ